MFLSTQDNHAGMLSNAPEKCSDLDPSVLQCYIMCCQAEAQEGRRNALFGKHYRNGKSKEKPYLTIALEKMGKYRWKTFLKDDL